MAMFCAFDDHRSLAVTNSDCVQVYNGRNGAITSIILPDSPNILAVVALADAVVHIITNVGVFVLRVDNYDEFTLSLAVKK